MHTAAAVHVKRFDRRDNFRSDGGLIARKENRFGDDDLLDGSTLCGRGLHRDYRLWILFALGAVTICAPSERAASNASSSML